ncbi:hypothetical protein WMY93_022410 [Mugilogobius chulae]|uniref:Transposase n=1 Tax=Mugilogobius chulae TaxID=88201 RepID=A0AAW0N8F9_9GOBI
MEEAETRAIQIESWTSEATTVLSACLEQQRKLQAKVTDLESRSRRNNVRIFGLPEGVEENSVPRFIESYLTEQLQLPGKQFENPACTPLPDKRKEYTGIKKILKEKGIRFQTPYTNMRIHWESGTRTYSCAQDVYSELRRRGFQ